MASQQPCSMNPSMSSVAIWRIRGSRSTTRRGVKPRETRPRSWSGRVERGHRWLEKLVLQLRSGGKRAPIERGCPYVLEPSQRIKAIERVAVDRVDVAHDAVDVTHLRGERGRGGVVERRILGRFDH